MGSERNSDSIEVSPATLVEAWRAVGGQLAVIAGSGTAVTSLLQHTPVYVASMRGAIVWGAVLAITSVGAWLAARTWRAPAPLQEDAPEGNVTEEDAAAKAPATSS